MKYWVLAFVALVLVGCRDEVPHNRRDNRTESQKEIDKAVNEAVRKARDEMNYDNFVKYDIPYPQQNINRLNKKILWPEKFEAQRLCHGKGWLFDTFRYVGEVDKENPYRAVCVKPTGDLAVVRMKEVKNEEFPDN